MKAKVDVTAKLAAAARAEKLKLEKQGLVLPPKPSFEAPRVPTRLTEVNDDSLMNLFVRLTRYADYVGGQLALAEIESRDADTSLDYEEAKALVTIWHSKQRKSSDSITLAKAEAMQDPVIQDLQEAAKVAYAKRKLIRVMYEALERDSALVSRELTRRLGREPQERRVDRHRP